MLLATVSLLVAAATSALVQKADSPSSPRQRTHSFRRRAYFCLGLSVESLNGLNDGLVLALSAEDLCVENEGLVIMVTELAELSRSSLPTIDCFSRGSSSLSETWRGSFGFLVPHNMHVHRSMALLKSQMEHFQRSAWDSPRSRSNRVIVSCSWSNILRSTQARGTAQIETPMERCMSSNPQVENGTNLAKNDCDAPRN